MNTKRNQNHKTGVIEKYSTTIIIGAFFILSFIIYSNTFNAGFHLDDYTYILRNEMIKNLDAFSELKVWTNIYQRPIASFTFAMNYHFHEFDVKGYHFINILIHIFTTIFVYYLSLNLIVISKTSLFKDANNKKIAAFIVALLFLSHPIQTQSVNYIVQRMALMAALFFFGAVGTYLKGRIFAKTGQKSKSIVYYLLTIILFYLASFSKQNTIVLPLVILLIELLFIRDQDGKPAKKWIGFLIVSIVFVGLFVLFGGYLPKENDEISREAYFATQLKVVFKYIQLLVFPISQNFDPYIALSDSLFGWKELLALLGHLTIITIGTLFYKKEKLITFGVFWFYITLLVESSIIPIRDVMFEHRLYLPSFGVFILLLVLFYQLPLYKKVSVKTIGIVLSALVILFSVMSHRRNKVWEDDFTLWYDVVSKPPVKARPLQYLSAEYVKMKDYQEAMQLLNRALELGPANAQIHLNKAVIYQRQQNINAAIKELDKCLQLEPENESHYIDRATLLMNIGEFEKSKSDLLNANELKPNDFSVLFKMGVFYLKTNNNEEAIKVLTRAIDLNPVFIDALINRGRAYMKAKQYQKAIQDFTSIMEIDEFNISALNKRASSYFSIRKYSDAIKDYDKLISIDPKNGTNYKNRAITLIRINKFNEAMEDLNQAQIYGTVVEPELIDYLNKILKESRF